MERIVQFDGLYGDANSHPNGEYLFSELLETRSKTFDWIIQPHIHANLFQVFFIESGSFRFQDARGERELHGPCLLIIPPAALHGFVYDNKCRGRILTISDSLLNNLFPNSPAVAPMLEGIAYLTSFDRPYSPESISQLIEAIDDELFDNKTEKRIMLQICLQRLFLVLFRLWKDRDSSAVGVNNSALQYFQKFKQCVRQAGTTSSIAEIAKELAITPVHLNRICRSIAAKSASQLLQAYVLEEARKYLTYTSYSVSEIAYTLHFEYPNYFARFFKKHTGITPTEFRDKKLAGPSVAR
ncbi:MAG TPA: helix-turn-helix domain-containing protein [Chryseolinea sp.]|nr:helix-turn-helix domain-containing protein [Chryseolinea sp.]